MQAGTRVGRYEILAAIGKGGMGEVWKARDTRLGREVAIKTLPDAFARDADRLARFEREAKLLASLNHPNIASIYGLDEVDGSQLLILELVEGETLADRLSAGAMPLDQSLAIAKQIVDAVEAAHEAGVVHRDLKPGNVQVTPDGRVKVLDFGLAKAFVDGRSELNLSHSPTLSLTATAHGVILGTAAYMSPEQARGVAVDKRADIWAIGCVLYEMLTGRRAFGGELASDVMASVLKSEPDYGALPRETPARLRALVQRCLEKDPKKRWRDAGDVRIELGLVNEPDDLDRVARPAPSLARERLMWSAALVVAILATWAVVSGVFSGGTREPAAAAGNASFIVPTPDGTSLYAGGWIVPFALSPDGRWLAFTATSDDGRSRLWLRPLDSTVAQPIQGTEGATGPFWSPGSDWLGFNARNTWYRVRVPGGSPEIISATRFFTGPASFAAWGQDAIVYVGASGALFQVPVLGGQPSQVTTLDSSTKERSHAWPQFLKDGRHFLYLAPGTPGRVYVGSLDGTERTPVMELPGANSTIRYAAGYLFYVENKVIWAQPFDEASRRIVGNRRRVVGGIPVAGGSGAAPFSVSETGVLAYWTQTLIQQAAQLQWIDRKGNRSGLVGSPAVYDGFDLSRNESKLLSAHVVDDGIQLWALDLAAGGEGSVPLPYANGSTVPVWTPDASEFVFMNGGALHLGRADGTSKDPIQLTEPTRNQLAQDWTAAGDLVYENWSTETLVDLAVWQSKTKSVERLGWNTTANEFGARLSPDNRWIAYVTDQAGRYEVWVAAYPSGQPRRRVANGSHVTWRDDGAELYYISAEGQLVAVSFSRGSEMQVGSESPLFRIPGTIDVVAGSRNIYQPGRGGRRFLVAVKSEGVVPPINIVLNWPRLLDAQAP